MDEFGRIAKLRAALGSSHAGVRLGIGDDAAIVDVSGSIVLSTDASIEHVHFRRGFGPLERIARRALHAAASDLAAMGADPVAMLVGLTLPVDVDEAAFDALVGGTRQASAELGMPIVGGNLSAASEIGFSTTVIGRVEGASLLRAGARVGDAIYVSGIVGAAGLGLRRLLDRPTTADAPFVAAWLDPVARLDVGRAIRGVASAAIDVSDGLAQDLGHLLDASKVGATIDARTLPFLPGFAARCAELDIDPVELALTGGEDYELVFTAPPGRIPAAIGTAIGSVDAAPGLRVDRGRGAEPYAHAGHRHFA